MNPPIKERIIGLPFLRSLDMDEYRTSIERLKKALFPLLGVGSVNGGFEIAQPVIKGIPKKTVDGSPLDWSTVRLGAERTWRMKIDNQYCLQLMNKGISFHFVTQNDGEKGLFEDLLCFYQKLMPYIVSVIDINHNVRKIDTIFINRMNNADLVEYIEEGGVSLNVAKVLNFPGIGVHSSGVRPCPPSFQTTSYFVEGNQNIRLCVELGIPASKPNEWVIELIINGSVQNVRLSAENGWGASTCVPEIHSHVFSLFKAVMNAEAFASMNIDCGV